MSRRLAAAAALVAVGVALVAIGLLAQSDGMIALLAGAAALGIGLWFYDPVSIPLLALPFLLAIPRIGGEGAGLSISDAALFGAFAVAAVFAPRPFSRELRTLLWLSVVYQATTLFTVLANPFPANTVEWFHAWLSVAGALIVGWAVGRRGWGRLGLTLLIVPAVALAVLTCLQALRNLGEPVYLTWPVDMHKNLLGSIFAFTALVAYARPKWLGWSRWVAFPVFGVLVLGLLATQARQGLVGLAVALVVLTLRNLGDRRPSKTILLLAPIGLYLIWVAARDQLASDNEFNSASTRLSWYGDAIEVWQRDPMFGMGMRWWTAGRTEFVFQPPNVVLETLSSVGIIGLIGFVVLFGGAMVVLWKMRSPEGTLAFCMLLLRVVQGQLDLFWSAIVVSVPFVIVGICLGAAAFEAARRPVEADEPGPSPLREATPELGPVPG